MRTQNSGYPDGQMKEFNGPLSCKTNAVQKLRANVEWTQEAEDRGHLEQGDTLGAKKAEAGWPPGAQVKAMIRKEEETDKKKPR